MTLAHGITHADTSSIDRLDLDLDGHLIRPHDAGYDDARKVFAGAVDRRPAAIARVAGAADVSRVVSFARETGLELAVRSGGHSNAGHGVSEGGIVLDLSGMRALEIDVEGRTAWAEAGLTAGEYTAAVGAHGLATGFGDTGSVGLGGITLAGGVGFLVRKHGLTIDQLLAAEVVTADGQLLHVDAETHSDLFWAIRGGGGNFGIATRFRYRLHEVDPVVGGMLMLPATAEVISGFIAEANSAPEELSTIANVMPAPPLPFVPEEQHGRLVVMGLLAHSGDREAGERAVTPFRALAEPIVDMVGTISYPELFPPDDEDYRPVAAVRTLFADDLEPEAVQSILESIQASTASMAVTQLRVLGGAMARVPSDATAFAHRGRGLMVNVAALYERPEEWATHERWVADLAGVLANGDAGAYVGFLGDEGDARVGEAYPGPTWDQLAEVKARYDPENLFRLNQNVPPAR